MVGWADESAGISLQEGSGAIKTNDLCTKTYTVSLGFPALDLLSAPGTRIIRQDARTSDANLMVYVICGNNDDGNVTV